MRIPLVAVALTAALAGLAGCGGDDPSTGTAPAAGAAAGDAATGAAAGTSGRSPEAAAVPDVDACSLLKPAEVGRTLGATGVTSQDKSTANHVECVWAPAAKLPSTIVILESAAWEQSNFAVSGIEPEDGFLGADRGGLAVRDTNRVVLLATKGDVVLQLEISGELFDDADDDLLDDNARALGKLALGRL